MYSFSFFPKQVNNLRVWQFFQIVKFLKIFGLCNLEIYAKGQSRHGEFRSWLPANYHSNKRTYPDIYGDPFLTSSIDLSCPRKVYELVAEFIKLARSQLLKKVTFNSCYTPLLFLAPPLFFFFLPSLSPQLTCRYPFCIWFIIESNGIVKEALKIRNVYLFHMQLG